MLILRFHTNWKGTGRYTLKLIKVFPGIHERRSNQLRKMVQGQREIKN